MEVTKESLEKLYSKVFNKPVIITIINPTIDNNFEGRLTVDIKLNVGGTFNLYTQTYSKGDGLTNFVKGMLTYDAYKGIELIDQAEKNGK